jgi:hypothetical protein
MKFTFAEIESQYRQAFEAGYIFMTCEEYYHQKNNLPAKVIVNRVDIDFSVKKTKQLVHIFNKLGIKASFFLRLHAPEYNPFSFDNYNILKHLVASGHELGYHSEVVDQAAIWNEDAEACLRRDIDIMNRMFDIEVKGIASHGGMTGLNNLDFWKDKTPAQMGVLYEAYDTQPEFDLFNKSFYISDSEWTRWKCYNNGVKMEGNNRTFAEHLGDNHPLIYLLIHPDTYYHEHFYEG